MADAEVSEAGKGLSGRVPNSIRARKPRMRMRVC